VVGARRIVDLVVAVVVEGEVEEVGEVLRPCCKRYLTFFYFSK